MKVKEVLMCRPLHYQIEFAINPWMQPGTVNQKRAMQQWEILVNTYRNLGVKVHVIDQIKGLPDMTFAADQGITKNKRFLQSNFATKERHGETEAYQSWFEDHGYAIESLPDNERFEGQGELLFWNNKVLMGKGFRTTDNAHKHIAEFLNKEYISIELINPKYYHLDTCMLPLNNDTILYIPEALSEESIATMKKQAKHFIPVGQQEAQNFCLNSVIINETVIAQYTDTFAKLIESYGLKLITVDVSEFNKSGGGIHCLTHVLY